MIISSIGFCLRGFAFPFQALISLQQSFQTGQTPRPLPAVQGSSGKLCLHTIRAQFSAEGNYYFELLKHGGKRPDRRWVWHLSDSRSFQKLSQTQNTNHHRTITTNSATSCQCRASSTFGRSWALDFSSGWRERLRLSAGKNHGLVLVWYTPQRVDNGKWDPT